MHPTIPTNVFRTLTVCGLFASLAIGGGSATLRASDAAISDRQHAAEPIPLPPDESVVQGSLSNGLRFAIAPTPAREGGSNTIVFLLQIGAGSAHEQDDQIGAAQLVAKLGADGTLSADPEGFQRTLDSLNAGRSLRSVSTYDSTRFVLGVPLEAGESLSSADIARAMDLLGSILSASGEDIDAQRIERARQDIVASQLAWAGPSQRITARVLPEMMGDSILARRVPIYTAADLERTDADALTEFLGSWYRAQGAVVVVSGPVDPEVVRRALARSLGPLHAEALPDPPDLSVDGSRRSVVRVETDPGIVGDVVQLLVIAEPGASPDTDVSVRTRMGELLAVEALSSRLQTLAQREDTASLQAGAFTNPDAGAYRINILSVSGRSGSWEKLTREAVATVRSAMELGFSAAELDAARDAVLNGLDAEAASERDASPDFRAARIAAQLARSRTVSSAEHYRRLARATLPTIGAEEVRRTLSELYDDRARSTLVVSAEQAPAPDDVSRQISIANRIDAGAVAEVTALKQAAAELTAKPGNPARVITLTHEPNRDMTSATLDSGVRLHHRMMGEGSDRIEIVLSLLGGVFEESDDTRGLTEALRALELQPATRSQSALSVGSAVRAANIDFAVRVQTDSLTMRVSTTPEDFETAMWLIGMLAREPLIEDGAFESWRASALAQAASARTEPARAALDDFERDVIGRLFGHHRSPTETELREMSAEQVNRWLGRLVREAPMTLAIIGDIDRAQALHSAAQWMGEIPHRALPSPDRVRSLTPGKAQEQPIVIRREAELATHAAAVVEGFRGADAKQIDDALALDLAAEILRRRLDERIGPRGELSGSTVVLNIDDGVSSGSGRFWVRALVAPHDADRAEAILESELRRLIDSPPTEQEFDRSRAALRARLDRRAESPGSWADALARSEGLGGVPLAALDASSAVLEGLTPPTVSQTLGRYAVPKRSFRIRVEPSR